MSKHSFSSVSDVAYHLSDHVAATSHYPHASTKNAFGVVASSSTLETPADLPVLLEKVAATHQLLTVSLPSSHLIPSIPSLYSIIDSRSPAVFHSTIDNHRGDYSDVVAVRDTGVVILTGAGNEVVSNAVVAHLVALKASLPVLNITSESEFSSISKQHVDKVVADLKLNEFVKKYHAGEKIEKGKADESVPEFIKPSPSSNIDFEKIVHEIVSVSHKVGTKLFEYTGDSHATDVIVVLGSVSKAVEVAVHSLVQNGRKVGALRVKLFRPWSDSQFLSHLPESVKRIAVIDIAHDVMQPFGPLFLDVAAAFNSNLWKHSPPVIREAKIEGNAGLSNEIVNSAFELIAEDNAVGTILLRDKYHANGISNVEKPITPNENSMEVTYVKLLGQTFKERLVLSNVYGHDTVWGKLGGKPKGDDQSTEFGFGLLLAYVQRRALVEKRVDELLHHSGRMSLPLANALREWSAHKNDTEKSAKYANQITELLSESSIRSAHDELTKLWEDRELLQKPALWLVGGDKLSYDIGNSGVHQVISSKENINILVLDTQPYSEKIQDNGYDVRKKDIGLYAMTYGGVFVASIALNSSYAQALRAIKEAEAYPGPSVVLAYAPRAKPEVGRIASSVSAPLAVLKETKMAVDSGYWPLYRWNPSLEEKGKESFQLDSDRIKKELKEFLIRDNHFAMVIKQHPNLSTTITDSAEVKVNRAIRQKVLSSYEQMIGSLNSTPLLILFGSDGGNAESLSKRIANEAKQKGLRPKCMAMDDFEVEDLPNEEHVLFVVSTAGQGEFPSNSKQFWKGLHGGELDLSKTKYAVFGLGDSHYWPLPEDAQYFAKAGRDLDVKLASLGAPRFAEYGVGDDQDPDGYMTGYKSFSASLWQALGVDDIEVTVEATGPPDDYIKEASNYLRGTIAEGLQDTSTGALSELDCKLSKFHGTYMQDDRDIREDRARQGLEPAYSFMIRVRIAGGVTSPAQWIALDDIADQYANGTLKITTRQTIQFHGILKKNMKASMQGINKSLLDTIAACGDVNRNVMCNPNPHISEVHAQVYKFSCDISNHLLPKTTAYHEIWLDKKLIATSDFEPMYGKTYLPRKFKIAVAVPPSNDVDVLAHDLGFIAVVENKKLVGFNVTVGGGMGMTHGNKKTYPRLADVLCYTPLHQAIDIGEKVMLVQRDYGDRTNRKHARLKYTIEDRGIEWFRSEVEKRVGYKLEQPKPFKFTRNGDNYGWNRGHDGKWHFTLFITNGRVKDTPEKMVKTALRHIATVLKGEFRFTPNQHIIISNIDDRQKPVIEELLARYDLSNDGLSGLRQNSMACVALPTCGLAMAESERYLPTLITLIEELLDEVGLRDEEISIRMTGCPNGCARPQIAEIAFVGKAPGTYNMYLGGGFDGTRLNKIYKESVNEEEILRELKPIIKRYALERHHGEHFGDFVVRAGIVKATRKGPDYHD